MQRAAFTAVPIGKPSDEHSLGPVPPAASEQDLARLRSALAKQEAWASRAVAEQQGLYMRLRGAEAQQRDADTAATAAARLQADAPGTSEDRDRALALQQELAEKVRQLQLAVKDGDGHILEEQQLLNKIRRKIGQLEEEVAASATVQRAARARRPGARAARVAYYVMLNAFAALLLLLVVNYKSVGKLLTWAA